MRQQITHYQLPITVVPARGYTWGMIRFVTRSVEETWELGRRLGRAAPVGTVFALRGMLGAGKTQLVRGMAEGAGVKDLGVVSSPTYVLMNVYEAGDQPGGKAVYHVDAYRVSGAEDFAAVGLEEIMDEGEGLVVVEWPERIEAMLPEQRVEVRMEVLEENERQVEVDGMLGDF